MKLTEQLTTKHPDNFKIVYINIPGSSNSDSSFIKFSFVLLSYLSITEFVNGF